MKKLLFATLCFALVLTVVLASGNQVVFAEADYQNSEQYIFLQEFVTTCRNRQECADQTKAALYLQEKFNGVLEGATFDYSVAVRNFGSADATFHNVVVELRKPQNNRQIIIGAHFDAIGEGANDNASGVTALYFILKTLVAEFDRLPCNVTLVAFGGEEEGLLGSYDFVEHMTTEQKQNTLLMVNIDSIANGDNLYLFCENKTTAMANFILQNDGSATLKEKPYAVGTYSMDVYGYGYFETIQAADFTPFRLENIPTAFFFSGNYVAWDYVESLDESKNTMNTNADTLQNLNANGGVLVERICAVTDTVCGTLLADGFLPVAENARGELMNNKVLFNIWWPRLAVVGAVLVLAILAYFHIRTLQKRAIMGTAEIKQQNVFTKPQAEDIFSFDGGKGDKSQKDDIDDIFSFKK